MFKRVLEKLGEIFVPIIPAFIGVGLLGGLQRFLLGMGVDDGLQIMKLLNILGWAFWGYLIIVVAMNSAKSVGGSPALGAVAGAIMISPNLEALDMVPGRGGVIGALIAGVLIGYIYRWLVDRVPDAVSVVIPSTGAILIVGLLILYIIQPFAGVVSEAMVGLTKSVLELHGIIAGALMGALWLPLVMLGFHHALVPLNLQLISDIGYSQLMPMFSMAGAGQVGAALAVYLFTKLGKMKIASRDGLPIGILGIGEPLIYGVTLPLGTPFIMAIIGGAIGGAYVGLTGFGATAVYVSGILAIITATAPVHYVIAYLLAVGSGFLLTMLAYRSFYKEPLEEQ